MLHLMKQNIAVIFGGCSSEHEISLLSASYILRQLDEEKYNVTMLGITKEGRWLLYPGPVDALADGSWEKDPGCKPAFLSPDRSTHGIVVLEEGQAQVLPVDVIFPVLHGKNGEDGTIQGLFALSGIPYVGCDTLSSAVCMDKAVTHSLLNNFGIEQAHYLWFFAHRYQDPQGREKIRNKILQRLTFPIFVKPANAGSSVGVSKVSSLEELDAAVEKAMAEDGKIVVEEGIDGQEVECAVLGNDFPEVSIVGGKSALPPNSTITTTSTRTAPPSSISRPGCRKKPPRRFGKPLSGRTGCWAARAWPGWTSLCGSPTARCFSTS